MEEDYLAHYGMKGQKWRTHQKERRWQNHAVYAIGDQRHSNGEPIYGRTVLENIKESWNIPKNVKGLTPEKIVENIDSTFDPKSDRFYETRHGRVNGTMDPRMSVGLKLTRDLIAKARGIEPKYYFKRNDNSKSAIDDAIKYGAYSSAPLSSEKINSSNLSSLLSSYKSATNNISNAIKSKVFRIDDKTGFKLKQKESSIEKDMDAVNPLFFTDKPDVTRNCMYCTSAFELRQRGYDVQANKVDCEGFGSNALKRWFPDAKVKTAANAYQLISSDPSLKKAFENGTSNPIVIPTIKALSKQGNGARGALFVLYKDGWGGHCLSYDVTGNGKVTIRDSQSNTSYTNPEDFLEGCFMVRYARLDNVSFDPNAIKEAVH